jgi:hypothetical protein
MKVTLLSRDIEMRVNSICTVVVEKYFRWFKLVSHCLYLNSAFKNIFKKILLWIF